MSDLAILELGGGRIAEFIYVDGGEIPFGCLVKDASGHRLTVSWAYPNEVSKCAVTHATLESLLPLTIREIIRCPLCGDEGLIVDGAWWVKKEEADA